MRIGVEEIIKKSTLVQSLKGILTAGVLKSIQYVLMKLKKRKVK